VELQANLPKLQADGIVPFAFSYDPVSVLATFAEARGITYPLLSDEGSRLIRTLGILNTSVVPTNEHYGIPYPGIYFVGEDGRVVDKVFHDTYRTRDAAVTTLREHFGLSLVADGPHDRQETDALVAIAAMDSATFVRGERIGLRVTIRTAPGVHIYGTPLPEGYIPTTLEVHVPETMTVEPVQYPPPHALKTDWLDEDLMAYEGTITLSMAVIFTEQREDITLRATLRFQACTTEECFIPQRLTFALPMTFTPFA
jgi:AhpC/TSA family protein/cytochrome c biogenesis DsbD-like protein